MEDKITTGLLWLLIIFCLWSGVRREVGEYRKRKVLNAYDLPKIHKYVENVNRGGCGYFAMKLYQRLDSSKYDIVVINDWNHVALLEKRTGSFIDANGYRDSLSFQLRFGNRFNVVSFDSLKRRVYEFDYWNPSFDKQDTSVINLFIDNL